MHKNIFQFLKAYGNNYKFLGIPKKIELEKKVKFDQIRIVQKKHRFDKSIEIKLWNINKNRKMD